MNIHTSKLNQSSLVCKGGGELIKRCRISGTHKTVWLPIVMLGIGDVYSIFYVLDSDIFDFIEMTAAHCFAVVAIWEG